jgi:hypothetical protein
VLRPRESDTGALPRASSGRGLEIGPDTCASQSLGDRLDLPLTIDALVADDPRLAGQDPD